jgi:hypothetical protein
MGRLFTSKDHNTLLCREACPATNDTLLHGVFYDKMIIAFFSVHSRSDICFLKPMGSRASGDSDSHDVQWMMQICFSTGPWLHWKIDIIVFNDGGHL